jgi:hypothetical protein
MSIIQISKILQRSGDLVDLPQLDQAEFGFASDASRLFIGKTTGIPENVEILTAYSNISFSQIDGGYGNLDISSSVADGELLVFDGDNWVNRGGAAGGLITLGDVSNVRIDGGTIGYVLTTDGTGNLNWSPNGVVIGNIQNVTQANHGVVTTTEPFYLPNSSSVTITGVVGMIQLNSNSYYIGNVTSTTFRLYSDINLTIPVNTSSFLAYVSGGKFVCAPAGSEGSANAAGVTTSVQFNTNNLLDASANFTFNKTTNNLTIDPGNVIIGNNLTVSGNANISNLVVSTKANLGAVGNVTITGGTSGQVLTTYGNGTVYWGAGGGVSGGGYYLHTQSSASTTWVINHNLNTLYVNVNPVDTSGNSYYGRYDFPSVTYTNANSLTLTWSSAIAGNCSVIAGGVNGNGSPGGANTYVQFNDGGSVFGGDANLTFNKTTGVLNAVMTTLTTGAVGTAGTMTGNWALSVGSKLQSTYADLAEYYAADKMYTPGTVLQFGGDKEVTIAKEETNKIAGVVSSDPAYVMNGDIQAQHPVIVALIGRVKVKVIGTVLKGDMLISAGNGIAKASIIDPKIGTVIGKAIENKFDGDEGMIEVMVGRL